MQKRDVEVNGAIILQPGETPGPVYQELCVCFKNINCVF